MSKKVTRQLEAELFDFSELSGPEQSLVLDAGRAVENAYAPYSGFCVGAAVLLAGGTVVKGSNQENVAYPSGLCAERVAIFGAGANYPGVKIEMLAVAAKRGKNEGFVTVSCCGGCRQAMLEYQSKQGRPIGLLFVGPGNEVLKTTVGDLLPFGCVWWVVA